MADDKDVQAKSKREQTLETCRKIEDEGRPGEIEPVPDEVHERALKLAQSIVKPN